MLWACLYFPQLPIDRQTTAGNTEIPTAVIHQHGSSRKIMACNTIATAMGVKSGMALNSAYAITPDLQVSDYMEDEQQAHLNQLALWAMRYSSWVTPRMPSFVLLEINASLKLFGGLDALLNTIESSAQAMGLTLHIGVAPTAASAVVFASTNIDTAARSKKQMEVILCTIPVARLPLDEFTQRSLRQSGIRTLRQLMDIPPAALTRRFGHQCTDLLYKLNGTLPDPCPAFIAPDTFSQAFDLPLEAPDTQSLSFPLKRLLNALGGYLKAGDMGVRMVNITLYHFRHAPTEVALSFLAATADHQHLFKVAKERLANTELPEPVTRIRIKASELANIERDGKDLFQKSHAQTASVQQVFDKLMARLGKDSIYTAMPDDDHRPENAWLSTLLETHHTADAWPARPLWLLPEPYAATETLSIVTHAERIENGWWDEHDVRRDYYIAHNQCGSYFWVFRQRRNPRQLYVHGIFS